MLFAEDVKIVWNYDFYDIEDSFFFQVNMQKKLKVFFKNECPFTVKFAF